MPEARRLFLLAGEPSGDMLGGRLMRALAEQAPQPLQVVGVGGPRMAEQGLASLFPIEELSLIGFAEILPHLPRLWRRMTQTVRAIDALRPDLVLTIDSPGFALRLQRRLAGRDLMRVHYVAPQVWAWHESRARHLARDLDHLLALLPFEPPFFERYGLPCSFVGHPIVEEAGHQGDGAAFRARHGIGAQTPVLCLLPGSRRSEVSRHLPVLRATIARLRTDLPDLCTVIPTLPAITAEVRSLTGDWPAPLVVLDERGARFDAYAASTLAIAASGTVSLEVALARLPMITIYRTGPLTGWLARRLINVPHVNMVNLILRRAAVPELLQERLQPERLAAEARRWLGDEGLRSNQLAALEEAVAQLGGADGPPPSRRAAAAIWRILESKHGGPHDHDHQYRQVPPAAHHAAGQGSRRLARLLHQQARHAAAP